MFVLFCHFQDWHDYLDVLKSFSHHHRFDGIVVLLSISDSVHHPRQQVAVYSNNTDILKQVKYSSEATNNHMSGMKHKVLFKYSQLCNGVFSKLNKY